MRVQRKIIAKVSVVAGWLFLLPAVVRAAEEEGFSVWDVPKYIIAFIAILTVASMVAAWSVSYLGGWIQGALALDPGTGGAIVYTSWVILRDMCNMAFIVALVLMAFATIFNNLDVGFLSWLKPYSIHARGVITSFLIAAILLNFSLAIGQTVVAASNELSKVVLGLLPKDLGGFVMERLDFQKVATSDSALIGTPPAPATDPNALSPWQSYQTRGWTPAQQQKLKDCMAGKFPAAAGGPLKPGAKFDTPAECYETVKSLEPSPFSPNGIYQAGLGQYRAAVAGAMDYARTQVLGFVSTQLGKLVAAIMRTIFLLSVALDFLTVLIFLLIRIPAIWILLALSPIAWTALAFPGLSTFETWWKQFWAWNLFSPLYLFVIYMGLLLLQNVNAAVAVMGGQSSLWLASVGIAFQYLIAAIVFVGGTGLVLKASFLSGTFAGAAVGRVTKFLGTGGAFGSFAPVGRFIGVQTGATAKYRGALGGIQSTYEEKVTKPQARRQEEIEARYKAKFGDSSAYDMLQRKRIQEQTKKNEDSGLSTVDMKSKLKGLADKGDTKSAEYFALSQSLLKEGELDAAQMKALGENASVLGGVGQNAIRQQIAKKIGEQAKEKKFGGPDARTKALGAFDALSTTDDGKEREKFLKDLKRNQLAVYAQLVDNADVQGLMEAKKLDVDANGKALRAEDIIDNNISKLEAEDIPAVMKLADQRGFTPGVNFEKRRDDFLNDKNNYYKLLDAADADQRKKLLSRVEELKKETLQLEAQKATVTAEAGVLAQERLEAERENRSRGIVDKAQEEAKTEDQVRSAGRGGAGGGTGGAGPAPAPTGPGPTPPVAPRPIPAPSGPAPIPPRASPRPTPGPAPRPAPPAPPAGGATSGGVRPTTRGASSGAAPASGPRQVTAAVTINGTFRGTIVIPSGASEGQMLQAAQGDPTIKRYLSGRAIRNTTYLLGRFNIVTAEPTDTERNEQIDNLDRLRQQVTSNIAFYKDKARQGDPTAAAEQKRLEKELEGIEARLRTLRR